MPIHKVTIEIVGADFIATRCKVNRKKVLNKAVENMKFYDPESFLKNQ